MPVPEELTGLNEADLDQALSQRGIAFILADPNRYVWLTLDKTLEYFIFYYPHWFATSGEQVLPTRAASDGALLISLPQHAGKVNLDFREPPRTRIAAAVSALGWLSIGAFAAPWRRRKR